MIASIVSAEKLLHVSVRVSVCERDLQTETKLGHTDDPLSALWINISLEGKYPLVPNVYSTDCEPERKRIYNGHDPCSEKSS